MESLIQEAVALERLGRWDAASQKYEDMYRVGLDQREVYLLASSAYGLAKVRRAHRHYDEAEELACLAWEVANRTGLQQLAARATNEMAVIQYSQGNLPGARRLYESALELARDVGDHSLISYVCQNLGVIANIEGNLREARALYLESISASIRDQNEATAMMAYNNLAMVCTDLGDFMEAEVYFDRGIEIGHRLGDAGQLGRLYVNRAEPLIQVRELDRACASLDKAEEVSIPIRNVTTLVDVARFRGRIARLQGDLGASERHLMQAESIAVENKLQLAYGEVLEELGALREQQGRHQEAHASYIEALEIFRRFGARQDIARVEALLQEGASVPMPQ